MKTIKCNCGYKTLDYGDMIKHLSQTNNQEKDNCKNKVIEVIDDENLCNSGNR